MPCTEKNYEILAKALKGKAVLEVGELKKYLLEKEKCCKQKLALSPSRYTAKKTLLFKSQWYNI